MFKGTETIPEPTSEDPLHGPSARSDAEESERQRWVLTLGELLRHTSTPMGNFILSLSFLEQSAGVEETNRVTCTAIYKTIFEELLVSTSPGRPLRQAPRMYVSMLKSLELMVVDSDVLSFIRVYPGGCSSLIGAPFSSATMTDNDLET